jgi:flagellar protein FliS
MNNNQYLKAYQKTQQSMNVSSSSHEIIRSLMKELLNSMKKIVIDIEDQKNEFAMSDNRSKKEQAEKKSKNVSKCLSIIYGLQTCLDFDKAHEIASNLFQLYEFCRQQIIKGFSQKKEIGIVKAIEIIQQIMQGWEEMPSKEKV